MLSAGDWKQLATAGYSWLLPPDLPLGTSLALGRMSFLAQASDLSLSDSSPQVAQG